MRENSKMIKWGIIAAIISIIVGSLIWKISGYEINKIFLIEGIILIIVGSIVSSTENAKKIEAEKKEEKRKRVKSKKNQESSEAIKYGYNGIAMLIAGIICILISKFI